MSQIEVQSNVPAKFDKKIYVIFNLEDGTNASYTLSESNKYKIDGTIKVGNAKLNFVKIVGNDDNQYSYSCNESINIKEGEKGIFDIKVIKNNDVNSSDESNKKIENTNDSSIQGQANDNKDKGINTIKESNEKNEKATDSKINNFFKSTAITAFLFIVVGVIYLVIKVKQR